MASLVYAMVNIHLRSRANANTGGCSKWTIRAILRPITLTYIFVKLRKPMKKALLFAISFAILSTTGLGQTPQEKRVADIQVALQKAKLDGWLFYDFRGSALTAPRLVNPQR